MRKFLTVSALGITFFAIGAVLGHQPPQAAPAHSPATVAPSESTVWGSQATTSTSVVKANPVAHKADAAVVKPTTTTSEVPPRLTADQEARIQAGLEKSDPDTQEHMGQDYDLPWASTTTTAVDFVETAG